MFIHRTWALLWCYFLGGISKIDPIGVIQKLLRQREGIRWIWETAEMVDSLHPFILGSWRWLLPQNKAISRWVKHPEIKSILRVNLKKSIISLKSPNLDMNHLTSFNVSHQRRISCFLQNTISIVSLSLSLYISNYATDFFQLCYVVSNISTKKHGVICLPDLAGPKSSKGLMTRKVLFAFDSRFRNFKENIPSLSRFGLCNTTV